ncbi:MAG: aminotransferase class V-fold PLP-dependent enzyme [Chloroflexi bacterium]|nr:aminotransferase class V-fold PLP-dependent enzyme [Chloroflexota bacterium]
MVLYLRSPLASAKPTWDIQSLRQEIPATQRVIYLNTGWSGPSPRTVVEAVKERLEWESYEGPTSRHVLESWLQLQGQVREAVARFVGASAEEISLTQNTTEGINIVTNGLPWRRGDEVVVCRLEHSSVVIPAYYLERRYGVRARVVPLQPADGKDTILDKLESALANHPRLLILSHVQYSTGLRLPLAEIQKMAHERGILVLVDGAQSVGQIPLNVDELGCDFYAFPGHKWLLGPDGVGALFVRRDLIPQVEPTKVSGRAVSNYDFEGTWVPNTLPIRKFELTTTSGPLWSGLMAAIAFLDSIGIGNIEARMAVLVSQLRRLLMAVPGVTVWSPSRVEMASGLVSFSLEGVEPQAVTSFLWDDARIVARSVALPPSTRLSVAFFNTEEEIEVAVGTIARLASQKGALGAHKAKGPNFEETL